MFSKKEVSKEESQIAEEALKAQDAPRTEPLQGTEAEIEKQAEDGMKTMGFTPVEENTMGFTPVEFTPVEENKTIQVEKEEESYDGKWRPRIRGNDYCPCGSNKKFKKCCASDEQKVKHYEKTMDIKVANEKTTRRLRNEEIRATKKDKISEKNKSEKVEKSV